MKAIIIGGGIGGLASAVAQQVAERGALLRRQRRVIPGVADPADVCDLSILAGTPGRTSTTTGDVHPGA